MKSSEKAAKEKKPKFTSNKWLSINLRIPK